MQREKMLNVTVLLNQLHQKVSSDNHTGEGEREHDQHIFEMIN